MGELELKSFREGQFPALLNVLIVHSSGAEGGASSSARLRRLRARVRLPVSVRLGGPLIDRCYPLVKLHVSDQHIYSRGLLCNLCSIL